MNVTNILKTYTDAHAELAALPSSDRTGFEAATARLAAAAEAMIKTPATTIQELADKVAFIAAENEQENDAVVARGLRSLRADLTRLSA